MKGNDEAAISDGVVKTYQESNLRYSNVAPLSMFQEVNTGNNLPAQVDIYSTQGNIYKFLFVAKGGGSANKTFLFQQTPAVMNEDKMIAFLDEKIRTLGTAACPPYHLAIVIGGTSAELNLKTVKLASTRYLDNLPTHGNEYGQAFRDLEMEQKVLELTRQMGIGAQFGGKYFCHDVRVIRLPRHGASVPIGLGVSCSADRQALGKITKDGVFIEQLEMNPAKYMPEVEPTDLADEVVQIDLNQPMDEIRKILSGCAVKTRLSLTGSMIVARDAAHAKIKERLDAGEEMPDHFRNNAVYYAGPAKTPKGHASGSFGPTTAGRMDSYVEEFQAKGGSFIMLAKGNRSKQVTDACKKYGGFYLGSIGGPGGASRAGLHQEGRMHRISRAWDGSNLADRGREFPRLYRRRRQGQRFLQKPLTAAPDPAHHGDTPGHSRCGPNNSLVRVGGKFGIGAARSLLRRTRQPLLAGAVRGGPDPDPV